MVSRETLISKGLDTLGLPHGSELVVCLSLLADLLEDRAIPLGLLGEDELDRIIPRHLLESAYLAKWLPASGAIFDVGSGAGLPGLVLACLRKYLGVSYQGGPSSIPRPGADAPVVLIEAQARRVAFLREVAHHLSVRVEIVAGRAEQIGHGNLRETAVGVTARALARPPVALELTMPLARIGAPVVLPVGEPTDEDLAELRTIIDLLGGGSPRLARFEVPGLQESRWVMIVHKLRSTPSRFPRPSKAITRRPLGGKGVE